MYIYQYFWSLDKLIPEFFKCLKSCKWSWLLLGVYCEGFYCEMLRDDFLQLDSMLAALGVGVATREVGGIWDIWERGIGEKRN